MMKNVFLFLLTLLAFSLSLVVRAEEAKEVVLEVRGMT
jgi:hypothetical protein